MVETAAHLADHVFPRLPVRQWVLSVPKRLRYFLQRDATLQGVVLRCGNVVIMGDGLRPFGKPADLRPYPTITRAPHFYPDAFIEMSLMPLSSR